VLGQRLTDFILNWIISQQTEKEKEKEIFCRLYCFTQLAEYDILFQ
jgi:hypothetical protein